MQCQRQSISARPEGLRLDIARTVPWALPVGIVPRKNDVVTSCYACGVMPSSRDTVGIRELKTHLSRHLKRVRPGARLLVTERGRTIATINPVESAETPPEIEWARRMVADGRARWSGGKPQGASRRIVLTGGPTMAETILEDRR